MGQKNLPLARAREHVKTLAAFGWSVRSQRGSHIVLTKPGAIATLSIPDHGDVKLGLLAKALKLAEISEEDYIRAFGQR